MSNQTVAAGNGCGFSTVALNSTCCSWLLFHMPSKVWYTVIHKVIKEMFENVMFKVFFFYLKHILI